MRGLQFVPQPQTSAPDERADVLAVVGAVRPRDDRWAPRVVEDWGAFTAEFEWDRPLAGGAHRLCTPTGAAVRSFFENGGRRCWVIPTGEPLAWRGAGPALAGDALNLSLERILPGLGGGRAAQVLDRADWRGLCSLWALPEVRLLAVPDLPELLSAAPLDWPAASTPSSPEGWVVCDTVEAAPERRQIPVSPPACDGAGLVAWGGVVSALGAWLAQHRRDVVAVLSLPLLHPQHPACNNPGRALLLAGQDAELLAVEEGLGAGVVQLVYPWLQTTELDLPGGLCAPDGALLGGIASVVRAHGPHRSAVGHAPRGALGVWPALPRSALAAPHGERAWVLQERVSLYREDSTGLRLWSDVTLAPSSPWRSAGAVRAVGSILRQLKEVGDEFTFEPSGPETWRALRAQVQALLWQHWRLGALRGASAAEAFEVRCGPDTMRAVDLDEGCLVVEVRLRPTTSVELLQVVLRGGAGHPGEVKL